MRRLMLMLVSLVAAVAIIAGTITFSSHTAYPVSVRYTDTPTPTELPADFTLIPSFVPAYPCQLQNVRVLNRDLCRFESVTETVLSQGNGKLLIEHLYTLSVGCWHGTNSDHRELRVCEQRSGTISTLMTNAIPPYLISPDSQWVAFGTFRWEFLLDGQGAIPRVAFYRLRADGSERQRLDTQRFPVRVAGGVIEDWSANSAWLEVRIWDGTQDGWYPFRIRADGSGTYERLAN